MLDTFNSLDECRTALQEVWSHFVETRLLLGDEDVGNVMLESPQECQGELSQSTPSIRSEVAEPAEVPANVPGFFGAED